MKAKCLLLTLVCALGMAQARTYVGIPLTLQVTPFGTLIEPLALHVGNDAFTPVLGWRAGLATNVGLADAAQIDVGAHVQFAPRGNDLFYVGGGVGGTFISTPLGSSNGFWLEPIAGIKRNIGQRFGAFAEVGPRLYTTGDLTFTARLGANFFFSPVSAETPSTASTPSDQGVVTREVASGQTGATSKEKTPDTEDRDGNVYLESYKGK